MPNSGIQDSLRERGVRLTRQRRILLDLIDHSGLHLDAERNRGEPGTDETAQTIG